MAKNKSDINDTLSSDERRTVREALSDAERISAEIEAVEGLTPDTGNDIDDFISADDTFEEDEKQISRNDYSEDINLRDAIEISENLPEFTSVRDALEFAAGNNLVLKINYRPLGVRRNRKNRKKLRRETGLPFGSYIYRFIEPYFIFTPGTGNEIVVTYDRSVRGIRSYIIDNIENYIFTGKRFRERPSINRGKQMRYIDKLDQVAKSLNDKGKIKHEKIVTEAMSRLSMTKFASTVGVQGFVVRNSRCLGNCYRQKRSESPSKPYHNVVMECLSEYNDYMKSPIEKDIWGKYASSNSLKKKASAYIEKNINIKNFDEDIVKFAAYQRNKIKLSYLKEIKKLYGLLKEYENDKDIYPVLSSAINGIVKESQQGAISRGWSKFKDWWSGAGQIKKDFPTIVKYFSSIVSFLKSVEQSKGLANSTQSTKLIAQFNNTLSSVQRLLSANFEYYQQYIPNETIDLILQADAKSFFSADNKNRMILNTESDLVSQSDNILKELNESWSRIQSGERLETSGPNFAIQQEPVESTIQTDPEVYRQQFISIIENLPIKQIMNIMDIMGVITDQPNSPDPVKKQKQVGNSDLQEALKKRKK